MDHWRTLEAPECRHGPFDISLLQHLWGVGGKGQGGAPFLKQAVFPCVSSSGALTPGLSLQSARWRSKRVCASCYPGACLPSATFNEISLSHSGHLQRKQCSRSGWLIWSSSKSSVFESLRLCTTRVSAAACFPGLLALACNSLIHLISKSLQSPSSRLKWKQLASVGN